jgi:flagellar capping protein FliD
MDVKDLIPVDGKEGWYRDPNTNAIINANQSEYDKYMTTYNKRQKEISEKKALQNDVSELKSEISEIKSLLKTLANKTVS